MSAVLENILGPEGAIARRLGDKYEFRPQQLEMAAAVERAFTEGHHLLVEAGTGVGKSFAYLLPAIEFAVKNKKRVVISTHTISLQEQLIEKDIPLLRSVYPDEFTAVLVQGPQQLPLPAPAGADARAAEHAVRRQTPARIAVDDRGVGRATRPTARWPICRACRTPACGTRSAPSTATAWARSASSTSTASGNPPSAACRAATSSSSTTPCSSRDLALRMAGVNYLPKYDLVDPRRSAHGRGRGRRAFRPEASARAAIRYKLRTLYDTKRGKGMLSTHGSAANDAIRDVVDLNDRVEPFFER